MGKAIRIVGVLVVLVVVVLPVSATAPGCTVRGIVKDTAGVPIPGATVSIDEITAATGADGSYRITGVAPGTHKTSASKPGFAVASGPLAVNREIVIRNFMLTPSTAAGDKQTYTMSGHVHDPSGVGVAGVSIFADVGITATSAADGSYSLVGLRQARYQMRLSAPNQLSMIDVVDVTGNMTHDITWQPAGTVSIHGYVRDALTSAPLAGAQVSNGPQHVTITKSDGSYSLSVDRGDRTPVEVSRVGYQALRKAVDTAQVSQDFGLTPVGR
jgi:hypothetical protein